MTTVIAHAPTIEDQGCLLQVHVLTEYFGTSSRVPEERRPEKTDVPKKKNSAYGPTRLQRPDDIKRQVGLIHMS